MVENINWLTTTGNEPPDEILEQFMNTVKDSARSLLGWLQVLDANISVYPSIQERMAARVKIILDVVEATNLYLEKYRGE